MMEIIIAICLGAWFLLCGAVSLIAFSKDFKDKESKE